MLLNSFSSPGPALCGPACSLWLSFTCLETHSISPFAWSSPWRVAIRLPLSWRDFTRPSCTLPVLFLAAALRFPVVYDLLRSRNRRLALTAFSLLPTCGYIRAPSAGSFSLPRRRPDRRVFLETQHVNILPPEHSLSPPGGSGYRPLRRRFHFWRSRR